MMEGKVSNAVDLLVRQAINKYYAGWLMCEDPGCVGRSRVMPLQFQRAYPICSTCAKATMYREYSDSQLYTQLQFITYLLDTKRMLEQADDGQTLSIRLRNKDNNAIAMYADLKQRVENKFLKHNATPPSPSARYSKACSPFKSPRQPRRNKPRETYKLESPAQCYILLYPVILYLLLCTN